jgi:hypothetical protein
MSPKFESPSTPLSPVKQRMTRRLGHCHPSCPRLPSSNHYRLCLGPCHSRSRDPYHPMSSISLGHSWNISLSLSQSHKPSSGECQCWWCEFPPGQCHLRHAWPPISERKLLPLGLRSLLWRPRGRLLRHLFGLL